MLSAALHAPGEVITAQYRIVALLGKGGMGETYEAEDLTSHQRVALKVLSLRQMTEWKTLDLFEREAKVLSQLEHPQIPNYLDSFDLDITNVQQQSHPRSSTVQSRIAGDGDRHFYIVRELVPGESLSDRIAKGWRPEENDLKDVATQILHILVYLHQLSPPLIHRDIKPANIIRQADGTVHLVDFGSVQDIYRETFLGSSTFVGTAGYMPPEQFRGQTVVASDLYSLGATLLYLATQRTPDQLPQFRMLVDVDACTHLSPPFTQWLTKLLEPIAEDRFATAAAALDHLSVPDAQFDQSPRPSSISSTSGNGQATSLPSSIQAKGPQKPQDAKTTLVKSPERFYLEIPLRPQPVRKPIARPKGRSNPGKSISVDDESRKRVGGMTSSVPSLVNRSDHLPKFQKVGTYIILSLIVLFFLPIVLVIAGTLLSLLFESTMLLVFVLIIGVCALGNQLSADTFTLEITPSSYNFRYLYRGRVTRSDGGDSQQLDIVLGDSMKRDRSSVLGCVLVDRGTRQRTSHRFGQKLSQAEQDWLIQEIRIFLVSIQQG